SDGLHWRVGAGAGWMYDGDYFLQNQDSGAPREVSTVNVASPLVTGAVTWGSGLIEAGAGVDVQLPLGEYSVLPSGEAVVRLRTHPHAQVGLPWLKLTAGFMFPWHVGVGGRAQVVVNPTLGLELTGAFVQGIGVPLDGGSFTPDQMRTGWVAVGLRR
ncbi:MAG: hypothetical protein AAFV53_27315, partial [Myxococcota bacterium]